MSQASQGLYFKIMKKYTYGQKMSPLLQEPQYTDQVRLFEPRPVIFVENIIKN